MNKLWATPPPAPVMVANDYNISASQLKTWFMCPRKWWFIKVGLLRELQKHHFVVGHAIHAVAERYLSRQATTWDQLFPEGWDKGLEADEAAWCRFMAEEAVAKGIWKSKPGITIEHPVAYLTGRSFLNKRGLPLIAEADTFVDAKGVRKIAKLTRLIDGSPLPPQWDRLPPFVGFIDHMDLPGAEIVDHKSAKNSKYVLSPAKLAKDVQVLSYAATPLVLRPELDQVHVRHNILIKEEAAKRPVYTVEAEAPLLAVQENWANIMQAAEDMAVVRQMAPITNVPGHPEERARNFHMVRSAIDMGCMREACEAYGGCPFKDACFGRATIQEVTRRLDAPDISDLVRSKGVLAQSPPPTTTPRTGLIARYLQERASMPFPQAKPAGPKFQMHQQVYARDPDNSANQFLCQIVNQGTPGVTDPLIVVYPNADVEPDIHTLPKEYEVQLPESALQSVPFVGATITGYAKALTAAGQPVPAWQPAKSPRHAQAAPTPPPAPPAAPSAPPLVNPNAQPPVVGAIETTAKPPARPERDGKFGGLFPQPAAPGVAQGVLQPGVGAALAGQIARVQADQAATAPPAPTAYVPQVGDVVAVKPTDSTYWAKHVGKQVTITEVNEGVNGPDISFMLDGFEQPPVAASRFEFVGRVGEPAPFVSGLSAAGTSAPVAPPAPALPLPVVLTIENLIKLKGQIVSVRLKGSEIPQNGSLTDAYQTDEGPALSMHDGKSRFFLAQVESVKLLDYGDIPGAPQSKPKKPRKTKEEKAAEKAAAMVVPIQGQQDLSSIVDTLQALPTTVTSGGMAQPAAPPPLFSAAEAQKIVEAQHVSPPAFPNSHIKAAINEVRASLKKLEGMLADR